MTFDERITQMLFLRKNSLSLLFFVGQRGVYLDHGFLIGEEKYRLANSANTWILKSLW